MDILTLQEKLDKKRRMAGGFFPTPFYKLENLSKELGINLFIKRDDFTGQNLFGGNKVRKLEFLLGQAVEAGAEYVFTYGATQSNHAMQTAAASRKLGLKPVLYLLALVEPDANCWKGNLLLDRIFGAEIHLVKALPDESLFESTERYMELARRRMKELEDEGYKCWSIPLGGADHIGTAGFIAGYTELSLQLACEQLKLDYIFHANGSGGTMAGLVAGRQLLGEETQIVSVDAAKHSEGFSREAARLGNSALKWLGFEPILTEKDFFRDEDHFAPGYELPSQKATEAIKLMAAREGLLVDPVYSGKALACLLDYVKDGRIAKGSNVGFWHTGGATALFAEKEILGSLI